MSDRESFLMDCVISIVSDDYESFEIIFEQISRLAVLKGFNVTVAEVTEALEHTMVAGLTEAYVLSPQEPHPKKVSYSADELHELWFYVTPSGKTLAKSIPELIGETY